MDSKLRAIAAWACLIFIIYATLAAVGARPELSLNEPALVVFVERFGAYALLGGLFSLAYRRHLAAVCLLVLGAAVGLELLQLLIPGRDARVIDAVEKLAGGAVGIWAGRAFVSLSHHLGRYPLKLVAVRSTDPVPDPDQPGSV
jgi:VanZ family protein